MDKCWTRGEEGMDKMDMDKKARGEQYTFGTLD